MKWTNSYRSFGLKTKRSTGLKTIEHKQMVQNPSNADEIELVVGCLKRRKLVPDSFTKQDYLTEMGKPEGSSKLDTSSDAFSQCLANPSK